MDVIDIKKIGVRDFYSMREFVSAISNTMKVWSWGARNYSKMNEKVLRFRVSAHRHKGYVYVAVNGADLFDVYLTSLKGNIKKVFKDVYIEDFINTVDEEIEKIDTYVR